MYLQPMWNISILDDDHVSGVDWFLGTTGAGNPQGYWGVNGPWVGCYTIVARANTVLENVEKINANIDPDVKNRILGEAYFLRGWAYFHLVQLYGGVPIRLKSLTTDPNANVPRASVKETYQVIIDDLKKAETMLFPAGHSKAGEPGHATRGLAKSLLAKVYLTMASGSLANANVIVRGGTDNGYYTYPKQVVAGLDGVDSRFYFQAAADKAMEVMTSGEYSLFTNWKDIWSKAGRNKQENMWQLQSVAGTAFVNQLSIYFSALSTFGRGAVWFTNNHYMDYEDPDKRVLDGVAHNYSTNTGTRYYYPSWQAAYEQAQLFFPTTNWLNLLLESTTQRPAFVASLPSGSKAIQQEVPLAFEPYHTIDYFASQGIQFKPEDIPSDKFGQQLKSFTEWIKAMKRLPLSEMGKSIDPKEEKKVEQLAGNSLQQNEVVTEAMAAIWIKQGNPAKAREIYTKLSLLEPSKSAYFANRINDLNT